RPKPSTPVNSAGASPALVCELYRETGGGPSRLLPLANGRSGREAPIPRCADRALSARKRPKSDASTERPKNARPPPSRKRARAPLAQRPAQTRRTGPREAVRGVPDGLCFLPPEPALHGCAGEDR